MKRVQAYVELGALIYDPVIGEFDVVQRQMTTYPLVEANANLFNFNATVMAELKQYHESCGFRDYIDKYLRFPPLEKQPPIFYNRSDNASLMCDLFNGAMFLEIQVNPCFNVYEVVSWTDLLYTNRPFFSFRGSLLCTIERYVSLAMGCPWNAHWIQLCSRTCLL